MLRLGCSHRGRSMLAPQNFILALDAFSLCSGISLVAQLVKNLPDLPEVQKTQVRLLGWEDPLEKEMTTHSSTLAWEIPWAETLAGCSPWGRTESDTTGRLSTHTAQPVFRRHLHHLKTQVIGGRVGLQDFVIFL